MAASVTSPGLAKAGCRTAARKDILALPLQRVSSFARVEDEMKTGSLLRPSLALLVRSVGWEFNWCFTENGLFNARVSRLLSLAA